MHTGASDPVPTQIQRLGAQSLRIDWSDGHVTEFSNQYLRDHCPCALCKEQDVPERFPLAPGQAPEIYPVQIGVVGRYAVAIQWSDGHDSGIYSYRTLRGLCPCPACRPEKPTEDRTET
jgi:DUF971 family protein